MSLIRYENQDVIVQLNKPQYGQLFLREDLDILSHGYLIPDDPNFVKSNISQIHIYSFYGNYIAGDHNSSFLIHDKFSNSLLVDLAETFREADISRGSYIIVMNLFKEIWGTPESPTVYIREISPDRTEVKLSVPKNLIPEIAQFKQTIEGLKTDNVFNNLVIDFGFNRVSKVLLAKFDPNDSSIIYLKLYKPINEELTEKVTAWFGFETMNPYVDTVILSTPIEQGITNTLRCANYDIDTDEWSSNATVFKTWNELLDTDAPTSQRIIDMSLSGSASARLNIDYTDFNNFVFYSSAEERVKNFKYKLGLIETYKSNIQTINGTLSGSIELITNGGFTGNTGSGWDYTSNITFANDRAYNVQEPAGGSDHFSEISQSITTNIGEEYTVYFSESFAYASASPASMQLSLFVNGVSKYSRSWSGNTHRYMSASFTGSGTDIIRFDLDVLGAGNPPITHGGTVGVSNISTIQNIMYSGSISVYNSSSIAINNRRINTIESNFDSFERWMYYNDTASIFTHDISGSVTPYPKYLNDGRYVLHHSTSSIATSWYNGLIATASAYDDQNHNRLWWSIPEHILMDDGNSDYVLFVDMVGQHFDNLYAYVKALTKIHERDEHPERGVSNDLLYHVAKSFGWKLQNTRQLSDLWFYKAGVNSSGQYESTGSMFSLSHENQTQQIWRRIVNNLPYLLKTKGTSRSVKALMSIYGIPQTLISIKEYGGPAQSSNKPQTIEDHFNYGLNFDGSQRFTARRIQDTSEYNENLHFVPETTIFRFKTNYSGSSPMTIINMDDDTDGSVFFDIQLHHALALTGTGSYSGSYSYGKLEVSLGDYFDEMSYSGSTEFLPLYDNDWWTVMIRCDNYNDGAHSDLWTIKVAKASDCTDGTYIISGSIDLVTAGEDFSLWSSDGDNSSVNLGGYREFIPVFPDWSITTGSYFSGSIQGYKEYTTDIPNDVFEDHVINPLAYHTSNSTGSYDFLYRYFPLGLDAIRYDHTEFLYVSSSHPNRNKTFYRSGSFHGFSGSQSTQYSSFRETHYRYTPVIGANNPRDNKIRVENSSLIRDLNPTARAERSDYDLASNDTNRLAIVYSLADQVNRDIYNHMGFDELDQWIASPQLECATEYSELKRFANEYFKKYSQKNDINAFIRILSVYDYSFFEQIRQLVPGRADLIAGILIEPTVLERSKVCIVKRPIVSNPQWERVIDVVDKDLIGEYQDLETSASVEPEFEMTQHYYTSSIERVDEYSMDYEYLTSSISDPSMFEVDSYHHLDTSHQRTGLCGVVDVYRNRYSGSQSVTQSIYEDSRPDCRYAKKVCYYSPWTGFENLIYDPNVESSTSYWISGGDLMISFENINTKYSSSYVYDLNKKPFENYVLVGEESTITTTTKPTISGSLYILRVRVGINVTETSTTPSNIAEIMITDNSGVSFKFNMFGRFSDNGYESTTIGANPETTSGSAYHNRVAELVIVGNGGTLDITYLNVSTVYSRIYSMDMFPYYSKWDQGWLELQNREIEREEFCVLESGSYQIDECGSRNNSRYIGTKMSSADFNVDSPDTVDGGPVVTIIESNPNSLFIKDDGDDGNLLVE